MSTQALEVVPKSLAITPDQLTLAQSTVAKDLTRDEFEIFLYNCQRQGIHPLDGLLVPIARTDNGQRKLTFVTTVDLLRSRAAETDEYAGNDDPVFEYGDDGTMPAQATVTVWKMVQGERCAFTATARYAEYYPGEKQGFMWRSKPHVMLGKCAEGLALRKAFPKQLAGLYLEEELQREDKPTTRKAATPAPPPVGNVKCSECGAVGGHLPKCTKRQQPKPAEAQPAAKAETIMCGDCGAIDGHKPECKYATRVEAATDTVGLKRTAVLILSVTKALKKEDKSGKREPYLRLQVVSAANEEFTLYVWHHTPQEFLTEAMVDKQMICDIKVTKKADGTPGNVLENIVELAGVPYVDNKPAQREAGDEF